MNKASLYKYHKDPRYYPGRSMAEDNYESLGDYYDDIARTNPAKNKINKKLVNKTPRNEKSEFFLGRL